MLQFWQDFPDLTIFIALIMQRSLPGKKDFREEQGQGFFTEPAKDVAWLLYAAMTRAIQAIGVLGKVG